MQTVKGRTKQFIRKPLETDNILKEIYVKFFRPIADCVEFEPSEIKRLDIILNEGGRPIREYKLIRNIKNFPGVFFLADNLPIKGITSGRQCKREFDVGTRLLAVYDERVKDEVIVELFDNWYEEKSYKFRLTPEQFRSIIDSLELIK